MTIEETHIDDIFKTPQTLKSFTSNIRRLKAEIDNGRPHSILHKGKHYVAVRNSDIENLQEKSRTDVAILSNQFTAKPKTDIRLTEGKLEKLLTGLGNFTTETVCFLGAQPISFVTRQAYEQMFERKMRRQRRAQRRARDNQTNGAVAAEPSVIDIDATDATLVPALNGGAVEAETIETAHAEEAVETSVAAEEIATENTPAAPEDVSAPLAEATPETPAVQEVDNQPTASIAKATFPIMEKLSHWDNLRANHREESFVDSVTLHRGKIVGVLMRDSLADQLGFDSISILSEREIEWATRFRDNYAGHKSLREVSGLTPYQGDVLFYATLGFMMKHEEKFRPLIAPDIWEEAVATHKDAINNLVPAYWRQENPLKLGVFHSKKGDFIQVVNGTSSRKLNLKPGQPVALLDTTRIKAIVLPGEVKGAGLKIEQTTLKTFAAAWHEKRDSFNPDETIALEMNDKTVTFLSPDISNSTVFEALITRSPAVAEMAEAMGTHKTSDLRVNKTTAPAGKDTSPVEPAAPAEPVTPAAPAVPAAPAGTDIVNNTDTLIKKDPIQMDLDKTLLQQIATVAKTINGLKAAQSEIIERSIDGRNILIFGGDLSDKFNDGVLEEFAEVYNVLKDDSDPALSYTVSPYEGSVTEKARLLKSAFDATAEGHNLVLLKTPQATLVIGNNKAFTDFIQAFNL